MAPICAVCLQNVAAALYDNITLYDDDTVPSHNYYCMVQISSKVICDRILTLVRDGFLQQVIGPALFQVCSKHPLFFQFHSLNHTNNNRARRAKRL